MNLQWFKFELDGDTIMWIRPFDHMVSEQWRDSLAISKVETNDSHTGSFVCTTDELKAFTIISKWLELGKPKHHPHFDGMLQWHYNQWKEQAES